ncbi:zinc ABC transporter substrate-binding protein [Marinibactrum halimedae]|uniref:High-affinity zinc uptake system protein ZnuA n=1 Tax=Marinibactrum halimedae TaxID=1444977 RepID=A0AA37WKK9_9GAMM|nr:zinc ABC transporter substrate-binding protein [Marinibactrum halimedae]
MKAIVTLLVLSLLATAFIIFNSVFSTPTTQPSDYQEDKLSPANDENMEEKEGFVLLTSIQPLYLIANDLIGDLITVERLLPATTSPHSFQLAVSDRKKVDHANVIAWVGPELEAFLEKVIAHKQTIEVGEAKNIEWPDGDHLEDDHAFDHHHHGRDMHIWLNPTNGIVIAKQLTQSLLNHPQLPESVKSQMPQRLEGFIHRATEMTQNLNLSLQSNRDTSFVVYHDAYQHLQLGFQLGGYIELTESPEIRPSAKKIYELKQSLKNGQCLLVENYYNTPLAQQLANEFSLNAISIDPLGAESESYFQLIEQMISQLRSCLNFAQ